MTATYCSAVDVANILGLSGFPADGAVTSAYVEDLIAREEDYVDRITNEAYKSTSVTEYSDFISRDYKINTGYPVYLGHANIFTLTSASGDKLEVWDGSTYEDLLVTGTEGRNADYWVDTTRGIVWIMNRGYIMNIPQGIRVTYRYGNVAAVPGDVRNATALRVAAQLILQDGTTALLQEGAEAVTPQDRANAFIARSDKILNGRRGFRAALAITTY